MDTTKVLEHVDRIEKLAGAMEEQNRTLWEENEKLQRELAQAIVRIEELEGQVREARADAEERWARENG